MIQDLNSEHSTVQYKVKNYIQQLKNDGVDGIRWDAAKHISLPSESCDFWNSVIDSSIYNYGEILDNPVEDNQRYANSLIKEYNNYMSVTDSKYSSTIMGAVNSSSVSSAIGYWTQVAGVSDDKLVYWAESHDTYSNNTDEGGWTKYIDQNKIDRAYAIVASRNGASSLYFSRPYQTSKTAIMVGQKGSTHYESAEVAAVNHFHNACIGEPDYYTTSGNVAVTTRESGAVLVLGSGSNQYVEVPNGGSYTTPGTYIDEISGNKFTVTQSTISGTIGSTGIAVFYKTDTPIEKPEVSASKDSCSYTDSIEVNFNIKNADSYTITVNGVENNATTQTFIEDTTVVVNASNSAGSTKKVYTYTKDTSEKRNIYLNTNSCSWFTNNSAVSAIKTNIDSDYTQMTTTTIDGDATLTVTAVNGTKTASTSATYVIEQESDLIHVYFTDNYNWGKVYAYTWGGSENTDSWPGTEMTYVSTNEYNQSVYTIEIASDVTGIIFSNGSGTQTVDITSGIIDGQGYYLTSSDGKCSVATYTYSK